jgi:hypothetical protein
MRLSSILVLIATLAPFGQQTTYGQFNPLANAQNAVTYNDRVMPGGRKATLMEPTRTSTRPASFKRRLPTDGERATQDLVHVIPGVPQVRGAGAGAKRRDFAWRKRRKGGRDQGVEQGTVG